MILVTGGTGLVGSHLLYYLCEKGHEVRAITRNKNNISRVENIFRHYDKLHAQLLFKKIEWIELDISDYNGLLELIHPGDEVYHCAAQVSFSRREKRNVININVGGTRNIVNACLEKGANKLCHVSSVAAIGKGENGQEADESSIWDSKQNTTVYALSKFLSEMEVWRGIEEGMNAVIVNPSIILGPTTENAGTGALIRAIQKGLSVYPPGKMGFVDVRDVAKIMILLMESHIKSERFILNSENLSYKEFLTSASLLLGKPAPTIPLKQWMAYTATGLLSFLSFIQGKKPAITREIIQSAFSANSFSSNKIKNTLNYQFIPVCDSLKNIVAFISNNCI